jgi:hypothetical protein
MVGVALLGSASGCGVFGAGSQAVEKTGTWAASAPTATPEVSASPQPARSVPPVATAGPACQGMTYDAVAAATGVRYDVAASSGTAGRVLVCVLQRAAETASADLTYVTNPVAADKESFQLDFQPNAAVAVPGLGKAAYSRIGAGVEGARSSVEVGWLGKSAVYTLTCTASSTLPPAEAQKVLAGLVALAKTLPA